MANALHRLWHTTWTRSLVLHPAILLSPALVVCLFGGLAGNDEQDVAPAFMLIAIAPVLTCGLTAGLAISRRLPLIEGLCVVIVSTMVALAASFAVFELWLAVSKHLCHGRSDCPF